MFGLKTLDLQVQWDGEYRGPRRPRPALALVYCFWIAYADLDGFRIDAAKRIGAEALRAFCDVVREFAQSIGKEHFLLVGEVAAAGSMRGRLWNKRASTPPTILRTAREGPPSKGLAGTLYTIRTLSSPTSTCLIKARKMSRRVCQSASSKPPRIRSANSSTCSIISPQVLSSPRPLSR